MRIEKSSQTVFTPLADGSGVLLNIDTLAYYKLNRTGAALWQAIDSGSARTLDDLVQHACEKYDVDDRRAHESLGEFLTHLADLKMIRLS